jgi:hypothetical protein
MAEKITIKKHLLSESDQEDIFQNTDVQAMQYKTILRATLWMIPVALLDFGLMITSPVDYWTWFGLFFLGVFLIFSQYCRGLRKDLVQRRWETFDRYGNQDFLFIELSVEKAFLYQRNDHLGPYWLGYCGPNQSLLLRGQNLPAFLKRLQKTKLVIILEHQELENVHGAGSEIATHELQSEAVGKAMEKLMSKKGLPDALVLKGPRLRWLKRELMKEIKDF